MADGALHVIDPVGSPSVYRRGASLVRRFMRTHPWPFVVSVAGAVMFSAAAVGATIAIGKTTDLLITPAFSEGIDGATVVGGVLIVIGVGLLRGASIVVRRYYAAMVEARMQRTLRDDIVEKYLTVPLSFHQRTPTGELLAHADADVVGTTTVIKPLPFSIGVIALVVFALVSLVAVDWTFALVAVVLFPMLAVINRVYTHYVEEPVGRVQEELGDVSTVAHESFDGVLVVKTLGLQDAETARFSRSAAQLREAALDVGRIRATFEPLIDALPNLGTLVLLVVGTWRVEADAVTVGDLVQASLLFSILAFPMRVFGFFLQELPRAVVSVDRVDGVLAEADSTARPGSGARLSGGPLAMSVRDVHYAYDGQEVLRGVTFDLAAEETLALVGATGSGKSTLLRLLVRLDDPDSGQIELGGVTLDALDPAELRAATALVFQESFLFASSLRENIAPGGGAGDPGVADAARVAQVERFLPDLPHGWDTVGGERGVTLSGGQRQRVALARALARRPRVLLLDDATSAVDPTVEAAILDGVRSQGPTSLLIVAHRLSTIRLADRVVFLEGGRVAAMGTHDELLSLPEYQAIVAAYEVEAS